MKVTPLKNAAASSHTLLKVARERNVAPVNLNSDLMRSEFV
jgi:hypothetical protein